MTRLPAKPLIKLLAPALAVLLSACAVVDRAPAPKLEAGARWVVLPFANATETPFAGQRAEAISEGLLRTLGVEVLYDAPDPFSRRIVAAVLIGPDIGQGLGLLAGIFQGAFAGLG